MNENYENDEIYEEYDYPEDDYEDYEDLYELVIIKRGKERVIKTIISKESYELVNYFYELNINSHALIYCTPHACESSPKCVEWEYINGYDDWENKRIKDGKTIKYKKA